MGFFDKLKKITTNLFSGFTEADEAFFEELEESLILADLGLDTAMDAVEKLRVRVRKEKLQDQESVKAALRDVLAEEILSGRVHRGDTVHVGLKKGKIVFGSETEKTAQ